ncbi:MAG: mechanosensitive ion channel family protein [bacterium]
MDNEKLYYAVLALVTLSIATVIVLILRRVLGLFIKKYALMLKTDPTNYAFLKISVGFILFSMVIFFIFLKTPDLKSPGTALFAGAGIFAATIGFASQKAFSNIISGIFILIFKPFKINDTIEFLDNVKGVAEEVTLRHTIIRNYENRRIVIPIGMISEQTIINSNITDEKVCIHVVFGISYDSEVDKAIAIIRQEAEAHPFCMDGRSAEEKREDVPGVLVRLIELGNFSVNLKAYIWTPVNRKAFVLKCDLLKSVFERFNREGTVVPFPYRTPVYKKDLDEQKQIEDA